MDAPTAFTPQELALRGRLTDEILDEVRKAHRDKPIGLFLSYFYNAHFDPAGFDVLRQLGIPSINFYCNSIYQFEAVRAVSAKVDFAWHAEKDAHGLYLAAGANPVWVQMGADPAVYHPLRDSVRQAKSCFVGQNYADRSRWMAALIKANIPVSIYGPRWGAEAETRIDAVPAFKAPVAYLGRNTMPAGSIGSYALTIAKNIREQGLLKGMARSLAQKRYRDESATLLPLFRSLARGGIPFEKIADVFGGHEVILNFSNVWGDGYPGSPLIAHVRLRDFEAPMCRSCYITGYTEEITEFYEPDREILIYHSEDELVDKVRYYLSHPAAAEAVREAGYRRASRDHTWVRRFEQLFSKTGIA